MLMIEGGGWGSRFVAAAFEGDVCGKSQDHTDVVTFMTDLPYCR
jgi:hypothetical protein